MQSNVKVLLFSETQEIWHGEQIGTPLPQTLDVKITYVFLELIIEINVKSLN